MILPGSRKLKNAAKDSIKNAVCDPKRLVAFHTAVILVLSLVALVIDFLLQKKIGETSGLSGVGMRSVLTTAQNVLQLLQMVLLPFWQIGWVYATIKLARGKRADRDDLKEGFRQFVPYLRLLLVKGLIFVGLAFVAAYTATMMVMMLPTAQPVMDTMPTDILSMTEAEMLAQIEPIAKPLLLSSAMLMIGLMTPAFYFLRMAEYRFIDDPKIGVLASLKGSFKLMRGNMWRMVRLDLSFWWFWLLSLVVSALGWADVILPAVGITLPWAEEISYFGAFILTALAQLVLYYFCKAKLDVTYAHAYLSLLPKDENT